MKFDWIKTPRAFRTVIKRTNQSCEYCNHHSGEDYPWDHIVRLVYRGQKTARFICIRCDKELEWDRFVDKFGKNTIATVFVGKNKYSKLDSTYADKSVWINFDTDYPEPILGRDADFLDMLHKALKTLRRFGIEEVEV